jgi:hypothetical protein
MGLRGTLCNRALNSSLSPPDRAMKAEPAYLSPSASVRASNASGAFVLRSRAVPMITNEPSVAFGFEPRLAAATSIFRRGELGDNALKLVVRAGLKECSGVSGEFFTEQKWLFGRNKLFQLGPSLNGRSRRFLPVR